MLALTEDDSAETAATRKVTIIKGHHGQEGSFRVRWDFKWTCDFSEVQEDDPFALPQPDW